MPDPFRQIRKGDSIGSALSASYQNRLKAIARRAEAAANKVGRGQAKRVTDDATVLWVVNSSGEDRLELDVLGIDDTLPITPQDNERSFIADAVVNGVQPDKEKHAHRFVVCMEPIPSGKVGQCRVVGVTACMVKVSGSSTPTTCGVETDETYGLVADGPVPILWIDSDPADDDWYWALVCLGGGTETEAWYQLTANLDAGGTATANPLVWDSAGSGSWSPDTSTSVTLTDTLGCMWGLKGERVRVKTLTNASGTVYSVASSGSHYHKGTITSLAAGGSASVSLTINSQSATVTVYDVFQASGSITGTIGFTYSVLDKKWYATNAKCN